MLCALAGMTSVLLVIFLSQARVFLAMARDGLLPHSIFGVVHEKFRTPHRSTILTGVLVALAAGFFPVKTLEEMVNIGTLLAFVFVCASVMMLRVSRPNAERPFRCPALFIVAPRRPPPFSAIRQTTSPNREFFVDRRSGRPFGGPLHRTQEGGGVPDP